MSKSTKKSRSLRADYIRLPFNELEIRPNGRAHHPFHGDCGPASAALKAIKANTPEVQAAFVAQARRIEQRLARKRAIQAASDAEVA